MVGFLFVRETEPTLAMSTPYTDLASCQIAEHDGVVMWDFESDECAFEFLRFVVDKLVLEFVFGV